MAEYIKDWERDDVNEVVSPVYNDGYKRYDLSMATIIDGLNNSKYPIYGDKILVPDADGNYVPLPEVSQRETAKTYRLEMVTSNGNIIKDRNFSTVLKAVLYEENKDITNIVDSKYFKWTRVSGTTEAHQIADAEWNLRWATGAKEVPIQADDVNRRAMFQVQYVSDAEEILYVVNTYNTYMELNNI
jgi:hypothetical protein